MSSLTSILVRSGATTVRLVEKALRHQVLSGGDLESILLEIDAVTEHDLLTCRGIQVGLPTVEGNDLLTLDSRAIQRLTPRIALEYRVVPLFESDGILHVAVDGDHTQNDWAELADELDIEVQPHLALRARLRGALAAHYGASIPPRVARLLVKLRTIAGEALPVTDGETEEFAPEETLPAPAEDMVAEVKIEASETPVHSTNDSPLSLESTEHEIARDALSFPPATFEEAEALLEETENRDEILEVLFNFADTFFDFTALFVVHGEAADGLRASSRGSSVRDISRVVIPLNFPSTFAEVLRGRAPQIRRFGWSDVDRDFCKRVGRPSDGLAFVMPVAIRQRVVLTLYGDRQDVAFTLDDVLDLIRLGPRVVDAFERLIFRRKGGMTSIVPGVPVEVLSPDFVRETSDVTISPREIEQGQGVFEASDAASFSEMNPGRRRDSTVPLVVAHDGQSSAALSEPFAELEDGVSLVSALHIPRAAPPPPHADDVIGDGSSFPSEGSEYVWSVGDEDEPDLVIELGQGEPDLDVALTETFSSESPEAEPSRSVPRPPQKMIRFAPPKPEAKTRVVGALDADTRSVIVDMGDVVHAAVERLLKAPNLQEEREARRELLALGERALPALVQAFPGPINHDRTRDRRPIRGRDISVVARALIAFRTLAVPYVGALLSSAHPDVRYYAILVASELIHLDLMPLVLACVYDDDLGVRRLACALFPRFSSIRGFDAYVAQLRRVASVANKKQIHRHRAVDALAVIRDVRMVPNLIRLLEDDDKEFVDRVHRALVSITYADLARSADTWRAWYKVHGKRSRTEWAIDGLMHRSARYRRLAKRELEMKLRREISFAVDASENERRAAHENIKSWFERQKAR